MLSSLFARTPAQRLDRLLSRHTASSSPRDLFGRVDDDFWFWALTEGYRSDARVREILPSYPPEEVQLRFAGTAGDDTMRDAFAVYLLVRNLTRQHLGRRLESVLEFGCGWGRITRFFLRDVAPERLHGIDCLPTAIDICKTTNRHAQFSLIDPFPPTSIPDNSLDLVYLYSVFSHLSEDAHLKWLAEFKRILKPGGLVIATTRPREFILDCARARANAQEDFWAQGTAFSFKNTEDALARYDRGEFLYEPVGGGDVLDASFFGETCIPQAYVRKHWTRLFQFVGYVQDRRVCLQDAIIVRK